MAQRDRVLQPDDGQAADRVAEIVAQERSPRDRRGGHRHARHEPGRHRGGEPEREVEREQELHEQQQDDRELGEVDRRGPYRQGVHLLPSVVAELDLHDQARREHEAHRQEEDRRRFPRAGPQLRPEVRGRVQRRQTRMAHEAYDEDDRRREAGTGEHHPRR
ncbi:hypothetical protein FHW12_000849 [Dokdonella fugitiva]|uniref:Uncharacterized protein n=1 Tax=Dokdonella fugitiva TaxID=328517 RepID=A0A839EZN3_9GAMM|nr:hypothetical protein [Dokdonella fugitiva]MBA8886658.1 hypothetical protein [Dokdonella fugitiva]